MMMPTRIVAVSYLNTIPFIYGIEHAGVDLRAQLLLSPPSECAKAFASGAAQIALLPVAAIPSLPDCEVITPYCIGASGAVRSVVLLSNEPLSELTTLYADPHSLSSIALARILCDRLWKITPRWEPLSDFDQLDQLPKGTGCVLIGDKVFDHEGRFNYSYDLAQQWQTLTSLPFAFAVWVARKSTSVALIGEFEQALSYGVAHIDEAIRTYGYDHLPYAHDYLTTNIDFVFDAQKRQAMATFWEMGMKVFPRINPG